MECWLCNCSPRALAILATVTPSRRGKEVYCTAQKTQIRTGRDWTEQIQAEEVLVQCSATKYTHFKTTSDPVDHKADAVAHADADA
jgi:hypothetical protein